MSDTPDELPEIQLEEVLDEQAPARAKDGPAAGSAAEIDIDFGDSAPAPAPRPAPAPQPSAPAAKIEAVDALSIDLGLDLDDVPPAKSAAAQAAPSPVVATPAVPAAPVAKAPEAKPKATPTPTPLDLDALLSDLELPEPKPAAAKEVELEPEAPATGPDAGAALPPELGAPGQLLGPEDDEQTASVSAALGESATPPGNRVEAPEVGAAPPLPLLENEPPARSALSPSDLPTTEEAVETLKKLAGAGWDADETRTALEAALNGEVYDPRALPEPRVMLLGIARVLVASGTAPADLVEAIMAALLDG